MQWAKGSCHLAQGDCSYILTCSRFLEASDFRLYSVAYSIINPPCIVFIATQAFLNSLTPVSACLGLNSPEGLVCSCYQFYT